MRRQTKSILAAALGAVLILTVLLPSPLGRTVDYGAGATGLVVDALGKPVEGAIVAVKYDRPVADAIMNSVATETAATGKDGRFSLINFACNRPRPGYTVTAAKPGMLSVTQRGGGIGKHRLVLRQKPHLTSALQRTSARRLLLFLDVGSGPKPLSWER